MVESLHPRSVEQKLLDCEYSRDPGAVRGDEGGALVAKHLVIFGPAGDLSIRYLLPAIAQLYTVGKLPENFRITGVHRRDWDDEQFRRFALESLRRHAGEVPADARTRLVGQILQYRRADVTDQESIAAALSHLSEPIVVYLALPPAVFEPTIRALAGVGLPEGSRIVVEKPFGEDLESARKLNRLLHETFPENAVFRVDHFLTWQPFSSILGLRFANRVFEPLWSRDHIERVEITWEETLALEGRAGYFDPTGIMLDIIQNHLLQVLSLVAMEAPSSLEESDLRRPKIEVLRAVKRLSLEEVRRRTVRARYGEGRIGDRDIPAYVDEEGVDPDRRTETFAQVTLEVDNERWAGVPFVLRTGKALGRNLGEVAVHFRLASHPTFGQQEPPPPNVLRLVKGPDRVVLDVNTGGSADPFELEQIELNAVLSPQSPSAYGRLLLDALKGDPSFFVHAEEAEESWRIVEPIIEAWENDEVPLLEYPAGSYGPGKDSPTR
jgi:glucose-6-phosphate 1-dehydrogenase